MLSRIARQCSALREQIRKQITEERIIARARARDASDIYYYPKFNEI